MSYETGTASSQDDLMTKLDTFLGVNGWTKDEAVNTSTNRSAYSRNGVSVQFYWDGANNIALFQSTSHDGSAPGANPNDSGNPAENTSTITKGARCRLDSNGPYTSYHFFESDTYFYVAVEVTAGVYRYFGAGLCTKLGTWTGGEFAFATTQNGSVGTPRLESNVFICDAIYSTANAPDACCVHAEGLPGQGGSDKWLVWCKGTNSPGVDTAANDRGVVWGGGRGGPYAMALSHYEVSLSQGFIPMIPLPVWYIRKDTSPDIIHPLGEIPDLKQINIRYLTVGQELVVGSDTWIILPMVAKSDTLGLGVPHSGYLGWAFKKVVT